MSDTLIQKRVRIVYEDDKKEIQTRTGTLTSIDGSYVWIINDFTGRELGIPNKDMRRIEGISDKAGVQ